MLYKDGVLLLLRDAICIFWWWCDAGNNNTLPKSLISKCASAESWAPTLARPRFAGTGADDEWGHLHTHSHVRARGGLAKLSTSSLALGHPSGTLQIQRIVRTDPSAFLYSVFPVWRAGMER